MPLTDILASSLDTSPTIEMARGNIGVVGDVQAKLRMVSEFLLIVPAEGDVRLGILYGQQGTELDGTLTGGGGGPTYFAY